MSTWRENAKTFEASGAWIDWHQHAWLIVGKCGAIEDLVTDFREQSGKLFALGADEEAKSYRALANEMAALAKKYRAEQAVHRELEPDRPTALESVAEEGE